MGCSVISNLNTSMYPRTIKVGTQNTTMQHPKYNHAMAYRMHTCSNGKCHTQIYHLDGVHTIGNKH